MDWQAINVVSEPAAEPVHLDLAKRHLNVDIEEDDLYIEGLVMAAREKAEELTGSPLVVQTVEARRDCWPSCLLFSLPRPPLLSVSSVRYTLQDGSIQTLDPSSYVVDPWSKPARVLLKSGYDWPSDQLQAGPSIAVRYVAGYGTPIRSNSNTGYITTLDGRSFANGEIIQFSNSGGSLPEPLTEKKDYYVVHSAGSTFRVSLTEDGALLGLTNNGTGQSFIGRIPRKVIQGILLLVGHWYEHREAVQAARRSQIIEIPLGIRACFTKVEWGF